MHNHVILPRVVPSKQRTAITLELRQRAFELIVAGKNDREVAEALGVSPHTIYALRRRPGFAARLAQFHSTSVDRAGDRFAAMLDDALDCLAWLVSPERRIELDDSGRTLVPAAVMLKAAEAILDRGGATSKAAALNASVQPTEKLTPEMLEAAGRWLAENNPKAKDDGSGSNE